MDLHSKILRAINKGLNEALDLDDFSEDDLKIQKKSLSTIILNSNRENAEIYYQSCIQNMLDNEIPLNIISNFCKKYNVKYKPDVDGEEFKIFLEEILPLSNTYTPDLNWIDTSEITDCSFLFSNIYDVRINMQHKHSNNNLYNPNISEWNVSNVTDMSCMFLNSKFNGDLSKWNVSNVTNMLAMFSVKSKFNNDSICNWNVSNVIEMTNMFATNYIFNLDLSKWNINPRCRYVNFISEDNEVFENKNLPKRILKYIIDRYK